MKERLKKIILTFNRIIRFNNGFSLLELMIVITIMAILALIAVPRFMDIPQKARIQSAKQQIQAFGLALDRYALDNGFYPSTEQGLRALVAKPDSEPSPMNYNQGGYMQKREIPKDPWGRDFIYFSPGQHGDEYEIMSYGADGKEGGEGENTDIKSWE